jgi:hypothetical protein
MNKFLESVSIPVEMCMKFEIKSGFINCPKFYRLLDMFNGEGYDNGPFIEIASSPFSNDNSNTSEKPQICVQKSSMELIAVPETNLARGLGSDSGWRSYPFVLKKPITVNIQLHSYSLTGTLHLSETQTMRELLNERSQFLPMTDVTISHEYRLYGTRPFAIVNKNHILVSREESAENLKSRYSTPITV